MAAITPVTLTGNRVNSYGLITYTIRQGSAQANTGQTDWVDVPGWAKFAQIFLNITAVGAGTPIVTPSILAADPVSRDDSHSLVVATFSTPPTAASQHVINVGPALGTADDLVLAAAADSTGAVNTLLPALMGLQLALNRPASETYTYNLSVSFRR